MVEKGILINTSLRWQGLWSHGHQLTCILSEHFKTFFYEPPQVTDKKFTHLNDTQDFDKPASTKFLGSKKKFSKPGLLYYFTYMGNSLKQFWKHRGEFDVFLTYNIYELPTLYLAKILGKKTLFIYADEYDELTNIPWAKPYLRFALKAFLKRSEMTVCTARVMEENALKYSENVLYLPNGVNLEHEKHGKGVKKNRKFTVGFVGSLEHWVDGDMMLEAAKITPDINYEIVGSGEELPRLKKKGKNLNNVDFVGRVPHEEVFKRVASWHVALVTFKINKITDAVSPIKLFEYWLMETAAIGTRTKELEGIGHPLVLVNNSKELARELKKLKDDKELLKKLGKEGKQRVKENYNWQRYEDIYVDMINKL